jgi:hypothetical protein
MKNIVLYMLKLFDHEGNCFEEILFYTSHPDFPINQVLVPRNAVIFYGISLKSVITSCRLAYSHNKDQ